MGSCDTIEWDMGQGAWDTGRVELSANREMGKSAGRKTAANGELLEWLSATTGKAANGE
jgi:hypothetical protein